LQKAYSKELILRKKKKMSDELKNASNWCELLILAKFMQFIRKVHLGVLKNKGRRQKGGIIGKKAWCEE